MEMFSRQQLKALLIPLLIEQLLVVLVGMADVLMVATLGETAVSGVALVDSINNLILQVLFAMAAGGTVVCSQLLGAGRRDEAGRAGGQLFSITTISLILIMILCLLGCRPILQTLFGKIEADVMDDAIIYFRLTAMSFPFLAIYHSAAAMFRAQGNTKSSMNMSLLMNVINITGNAICIFGLHMGVEGVGIPTLISRMIAAFGIVTLLQKKKTTGAGDSGQSTDAGDRGQGAGKERDRERGREAGAGTGKEGDRERGREAGAGTGTGVGKGGSVVDGYGNELRVPSLSALIPNGRLIKRILSIGIPNSVESGVFQFGKLTLQSLVSSLGTPSIAAFAVASNLVTYLYLPGNALGAGMLTIVGRCYGAGEYEQARSYARRLVRINYIMLAIICTVLIVGSSFWVGCYQLTGQSAELARGLLISHSVAMILWPIGFLYPYYFRAIGKAAFTMVVAISTMWTFRIGLAFLFIKVLHMNVLGIWYAMFVDWIARVIIYLTALRKRYGEKQAGRE